MIEVKKPEQLSELKYVSSERECTELGVLYKIIKYSNTTLVFRYENNKQIFSILLEEGLEGGVFGVSLISESYGFADLGGINILAYTANLKRMLVIMRNMGFCINKIQATHLSNPIKSEEIDKMRAYLTQIGISKDDVLKRDNRGLVTLFLNKSKIDLKFPDEYKTVRDVIFQREKNSEIEHSEHLNAKEKRYRTFLIAIKKAFKNENVEIKNDENKRTYEILFK